MPSDLRDNSALNHMLAYCEEIERTLGEISGDRNAFDNSSTHRNALALCVLQIGELVGVLSEEYKDIHKEVPWRDIKQMRNVVAHKYGSFDFDILWEVVNNDIPTLKNFCKEQVAK